MFCQSHVMNDDTAVNGLYYFFQCSVTISV
jgi:hypothetical protein